MADWTKPDEEVNYELVLDLLKDLIKSAASMNYSSDTNVPDGHLKYDRITKNLRQLESGIWVDKEITGLADNAVTTAKIADLQVTGDKIQDGVISKQKMANNSVDTSQIVDDSVTESKLTADAASRSTKLATFFGNYAGGGGTQVDPAQLILGSALTGASATEFFTMWTAPKAGKITHMTIELDDNLGGGSLTATIALNGFGSVGCFFTASGSGTPSYGKGGALNSPVTFSGGEMYYLIMSGTSGIRYAVTLWGHFTE